MPLSPFRPAPLRPAPLGPAPRDARLMRAGGWLAALLVAALAGGAFAALGWAAVGRDGLSLGSLPYLARVTGFTLWQAALSTVLSVGLAVPLARSLARRPRFAGRGFVVALLGLPLVVPALVAALAVIAVWGREGAVNDALAWAGLERVSIYGLPGILIAHVFFNMPLAARLLLRHLAGVPAARWRLAAQLGLPPLAAWRLVEWPALRLHLGGVALLVFALCATSFAVVLTLGGGPRSTTLEVAIYQALRFDFLPGRAVALALVQLALTGAIALALRGRAAQWDGGSAAVARPPPRRGAWADAAVIVAGMAFVLAPLVALTVAGLAADLTRLAVDPAVRGAVATSLALGTLAASLALALTAALVLGAHAGGRALGAAAGAVASLVLVVPPVVVGAGWFVALLGAGLAFAAAPVMIVTVNAVMALPFTVRIVGPAWARHARGTDRLARALGLAGVWRLWRLDLPAMRGALALAFALALALSLGDLGVVALFGSEDWRTLPLLLQQRMGSYRTDDAAGLALVLGALCLGVVGAAQLAERRR